MHASGIMCCFYRCFWRLNSEQQGGAVEACWAHNPEVDGSKLFPARNVSFCSIFNFSSILFHHLLFPATFKKMSYCLMLLGVRKLHSFRIKYCFYSCFWKRSAEQQGGAVEACWAHNPAVVGSKSFPAKNILIFFDIPRKLLLSLKYSIPIQYFFPKGSSKYIL